MKDSDKLKVGKLNDLITKEVRGMLNRYSSRCSKLTVSTDPHAPVIAWVQMALATSAAEYMVAQGCTMSDGINASAQTIELAMNHWLSGLQRHGVDHQVTEPETMETVSND